MTAPCTSHGGTARAALLSIEALRLAIIDRRTPVELLHGVSFEVCDQARVGMVGESGSGKSLTATAIMGLLPEGMARTGGTLNFAGRDLSQLGERELHALRGAQISMIFQNALSSLNPLFTVGSQIAAVCRAHLGLSRRQAFTRAVEMLDALGVADPKRRANDYPHQFSGGMAQRVAIAAALVCSPRLLIADEPTTGLDATIQLQVLEAIDLGIRQSGAALLLISHDLATIRSWTDDIVVLYGGMVLESGPTQDVLEHPLSPYSQRLVACLEPAAGEVAYIPGRVPDPASIGEQCSFASRCTLASDRCWRERPLPRPAGDGRLVACHEVSV